MLIEFHSVGDAVVRATGDSAADKIYRNTDALLGAMGAFYNGINLGDGIAEENDIFGEYQRAHRVGAP